MPLSIEEVTTEDLVRELSPEALQYFAQLELSDEWPSYESVLSGKFVRLGEVLLLGCTISHGKPDYRGSRHSIKHIDLLDRGFMLGDEVVEKIEATAPKEGEYLKGHWPLMDAGWSRIYTGSDGLPRGLKLDDRSYDFGQASEAIRHATGEIAQRILGSEIAVTAELG